jgi:hypothetical protein
MSRLDALLGRIERASDRLSPIVVKEVRQLTRGREFHVSFAGSLLIGLAIASMGAANALSGTGTSGGWTFVALMACLAILGLGVVPLGAFNALRNERLEQTLELITLTTLSPRRIVMGKLLAQGVKLATLFAGLAPFVAMSFLLGGIDFGTILVSMLVLFMWSLWSCAACLFLSSLFKTRAMSGFLFGGVGVIVFLGLVVFVGSRALFFVMMSAGGMSSVGVGFGGSASWWTLAMSTAFCLVSMANLVLLAENRLSLASENRITPLRVGLLVQFLLIVACTVSFINDPSQIRSAAATTLGVFGGLHLAIVALFTVAEDLVLPRRVLLAMRRRPAWQRPFAMFLPGGGRAAVYVLMQMAIMLGAARLLDSSSPPLWFFVAACGYICFYTGVPVAAFRLMRPSDAASFPLRVAVLVLLPLAILLPDILAYMANPAGFDGDFSARHLLNPFRTLASHRLVEERYGFSPLAAMGLTGLLAYATLIHLGMRMTARSAPIEPRDSAAAAGAGGADILY